jgi:hypothetical protein
VGILPELSHLSPILTASPGRNHFTEEHKAFVREKVDEGVSNSRTIHEALNLKFELVGPDTVNFESMKIFRQNYRYLQS